MKEFWILIGVLVLWIALNRWVLPWFGIQTCMSGACSAGRCAPCASQSWSEDHKDVPKPEGDTK